MKISHVHQFIFIHAPKTAGSSIARALDPFSHQPQEQPVNRLLSKIGVNVNWYGPLEWRRGRKHTDIRQLERMLPATVFRDYFKFAFVRNPWDLLVSYYHYIASNKQHHRNRKIRDLDSFEDYLGYEIRRNKINQSKFTHSASGVQQVDFLGRFEHLESDFKEVCQRIGIEAVIPHANRSDHRNYREYYNASTKALVAEHWAEDIERFGYTFDNGI